MPPMFFNGYVSSCVVKTMALLKYVLEEEGETITQQLTIQNCADTSLTEKDLECVDENVSSYNVTIK